MDHTPGTVIGGRYQIVSKIAAGGMGAVYRAQHTLSRRMVALKVIHAEAATDESTRQRFLREVAAPAQIGHRGLVEIYDAGFDAQSLFVAMELLEGETLRELLERGPISRERAFSICLRLLEPLAAAHAAGFVHRDLKPENVFLQRTAEGQELVKLLDFGIARHLRGDSDIVTQAGVAMGTPHYMSPEQAASARDVDETTDVWAVGVMLYETLTGSPPFRGDTLASLVVDVLTRPHRALLEVLPNAPLEVSALLDRALDKSPHNRPKNAGALLAELRTALDRPEGGSGVHVLSPAAITAPMSSSSPGSSPHDTFAASTTSAPGTPRTSSAKYDDTPPTAESMPVFGSSFQQVRPVRTPAPTVPLSSGSAPGTRSLPGSPSYAEFAGPHAKSTPGSMPGSMVPAGAPAPTGRSRTALFALLGLALGGIGLLGALVLFVAGSWLYASAASRSVSGTLDLTDGRLATGVPYDRYDFEWRAGQHVTLDVHTAAYDPRLIVQSPSGRQYNDDPWLPGAHLELVLEESGTYQVLVAGTRMTDLGAYELEVH